ncbi:MAG: gp58-like family protein [Liquorilactobacillus nagelii]|uniref:gp58-like family protein n=1 Tax=Lactobacillaceae TaxID=33958 RepID=UPI0039EB621A
MITQSDAALAAWRATERTLDAKVVITDSNGKSTEYGTADITSIGYDSGAWTGDTFSIGSTYENNITVAFAHLVEGLKQGFKVTAKIGIKLPDGTYEYAPLGIFIISDEITMDRNNDATTIKAYDQMCVMQGTYTSKLTYPAKVVDVIAEIANMAGVKLNTDDIARLPVLQDLPSAINGQSYCTAIGWIAQFYGGFATFDCDGKLTIRQVTDASYTLDPGQYLQAGLTKNEATYQIGGIQCQVTTTTKDSTGESSENTTTLQAGSTAGSQIQITNNLMTQDRLDAIWNSIKDITFYPYSLTWFGNPAVEAGDWLTLQDTKGNKFNVPNNSYTMTFDGSLSATSKADQTSTSSSSYSYSGTLSQTVKQLAGRQGATGNYIYGTDITVAPANAKNGDLWYKQNGNKVEMWLYEKQPNGTGKWVKKVDDLTGAEISEKVNTAISDADIAKQNANTAVETGNSALAKAQTGIDTANAAADKASDASVDASKAINDSASAIAQAQSAASAASNSVNIATAVKQSITELKGGSTATIAELEDGLALKLTKDDLDGYATEDWTSNQITTTASRLQEQITSVKKAVDTATTNVTTLTTDVNGLKTSVSTVTNTANQSKVDISTLQQQATGFQANITSLQQTKADQSWTTNQINATSNSLKVTIADIQGQVNDSAVGNNILTGTLNWTDWVVNGTIEQGTPDIVHHSSTATTQNTDIVQYHLLNLESSKTYTASFYAKGTGSFIFYCYPNVGFTAGDNRTVITLTDTFKRYTITFTTVSNLSGVKNFLLRNNVATLDGTSNTVEVWVYGCKVESGPHATDWCQNAAELATASSVVALSATVDSLSSIVSKKVDTTTFTSYQTQTATAMADKVSSGAFNSYKTQTDSAIQSKVSSADYNTKVTQLSNMINSKVSQSDWTNSAVGTNLIPNSSASQGGIWGYNSSVGTNGNYKNGSIPIWVIHNSSKTAEVTSGGKRFVIEPNTQYTLSFTGLMAGNVTNVDVYVLGSSTITDINDTSSKFDIIQEPMKEIRLTPGTAQVYSSTFTTPAGVKTAYVRFDNNSSTNGSDAILLFTDVKIEKGTHATAWCPAASEIANYSQIQQLSDNINLRVQKNDVINQINVSSESILIAGNKVHITGSTTIDNAVIKSAMIDSLSADKITAGTLNAANVNIINMNANNISTGTLSGVSIHQNSNSSQTWIDNNGIHNTDNNGRDVWIKNGTLRFEQNSTEVGSIYSGSIAQGSGIMILGDLSSITSADYNTSIDVFKHSLGGISIRDEGDGKASVIQANGYIHSTVMPTNANSTVSELEQGINSDGTPYLNINASSSSNTNMIVLDKGIGITSTGMVSIMGSDMQVYSDFSVVGSKNAIVETSAGWARINAYETAEYYFGDIAKVNTGSGSKVKIMMDSLFLETVNTNIDYHVFVSSYGAGYAWVSKQTSTYFVIESNVPNLEVSYEIKAKRKGYENVRLEIDKDFRKEAA